MLNVFEIHLIILNWLVKQKIQVGKMILFGNLPLCENYWLIFICLKKVWWVNFFCWQFLTKHFLHWAYTFCISLCIFFIQCCVSYRMTLLCILCKLCNATRFIQVRTYVHLPHPFSVLFPYLFHSNLECEFNFFSSESFENIFSPKWSCQK